MAALLLAIPVLTSWILGQRIAHPVRSRSRARSTSRRWSSDDVKTVTPRARAAQNPLARAQIVN